MLKNRDLISNQEAGINDGAIGKNGNDLAQSFLFKKQGRGIRIFAIGHAKRKPGNHEEKRHMEEINRLIYKFA